MTARSRRKPSPLPEVACSDFVRAFLLALLKDCFDDEIAHLELRMIRDAQAPRFEALKKTHPEIYADFMRARTGPHETLLKNRRKRVKVLTAIIEGSNEKLRDRCPNQ